MSVELQEIPLLTPAELAAMTGMPELGVGEQSPASADALLEQLAAEVDGEYDKTLEEKLDATPSGKPGGGVDAEGVGKKPGDSDNLPAFMRA